MQSSHSSSLTPIEQSRFDKLQDLEQAGIICFPARFDRTEIANMRDSVASMLPSPILHS